MALGSGQKRLSDTLPESRKYRRSMHLKQDVKRGQPLTPDLFEFRRPGWGIGPDVFEAFLGKRFSCDMPAGAMVELQNLVDD
jgi:sialic acid synthase SpsE